MATAVTQRPSVLLATLVVVASLVYAAYLSPHHWAAAGLACMTGSALVAAPELIEHLLRSAAHQYVKRAAQVVARGARLLSLVLYALALVIVVLSALGGAHQAISVSIFLLILIGFIEIVARQTRRIIGDIATGGDVDVRFAERFGPSARWGIAGTLFLAGTLIQLIGTFVE